MHKKPPEPATKAFAAIRKRSLLRFWFAVALSLSVLPKGGTWADDRTLDDASSASGSRLTLVELYTSQGCSSCPPADTFLRELSDRDDVLALSFHVDYWNSDGWADPFSDGSFSARQRAYKDALNTDYIYTPQMVVSGQFAAPGGQRTAVLNAIQKGNAPLAKSPTITLSRLGNDRVSVRVSQTAQSNKAVLYAAIYNAQQITRVRGGENRGRILRNINVVKRLIALSPYTGEALSHTLSLSSFDGIAVFLQTDPVGPVLSASALAPRTIRSAQADQPRRAAALR